MESPDLMMGFDGTTGRYTTWATSTTTRRPPVPSPLSPLHSRSSAGRLPCRLKLLFTEALHLCFYTNHHVLNGMSSPFNATLIIFHSKSHCFSERPPHSRSAYRSAARHPSAFVQTPTHNCKCKSTTISIDNHSQTTHLAHAPAVVGSLHPRRW